MLQLRIGLGNIPPRGSIPRNSGLARGVQLTRRIVTPIHSYPKPKLSSPFVFTVVEDLELTKELMEYVKEKEL